MVNLLKIPEAIGNSVIAVVTKIFHPQSHPKLPLFERKGFYIAFVLLVLVAPSYLYFTLKGKQVQAAWYDSNYGYRVPVTINYSGSTLTNYDVLIHLDTASLTTAKMQADCDDIRVTDSDETTPISYWVEGGCDTSYTQIWAQVPSIPDGGKTIYLYYGYASAVNAEETWTGKFIALNNASCPTGWTSESDTAETFDTNFPYGASTYGGTGGSSSHSHGGLTNNTSGNGSQKKTMYSASASSASRTAHSHAGVNVGVNAKSVLPSYLDMLFCSNSDLNLKTSLVALYNDTQPTGWSRFTALDDKFPRGSGTYGGSGGGTSHNHTSNPDNTAGPSQKNSNILNGSDANVASASHTHSVAPGTLGGGTHTPPYLDMIYGQASTDGYATASAILMADATPPLGWSRFTNLDSKFPRGSDTYGGSSGSTAHTHSASDTTSNSGTVTRAANPNGEVTAANHSHSWSDTTDTASNLPPYVNTLFIKRDAPAATTFVGSEETDNQVPNTPTLDSPTDTATGQSWYPALKTTTTDTDGDYLRYKIELCTDVAMTTDCNTYTQTGGDQTGWSGQDAESGTAYASGTQATYTLQSPLDSNTTYYWRSYAIDPGGSNTYSSTQGTPYSFTTNATPSPPTNCTLQEAADDSSITVSWTDNATSEDSYDVDRSANAAAFSDLTSTDPDATSHIDSTISQGNTYAYRLRASLTHGVTTRTSAWCYTPTLSIQSGSFLFEGLKLEGVKLNLVPRFIKKLFSRLSWGHKTLEEHRHS